jgi:hypothetical protein
MKPPAHVVLVCVWLAGDRDDGGLLADSAPPRAVFESVAFGIHL